MRLGRFGLACLLGGLCAVGCRDRWATVRQELGPAADIATASMENLGWETSAGKVTSVRFSAVVTTYDKAGKSFTDLQEMVVDLKKDTIAAVGQSPQGRWEVRAYDRGTVRVRGSGDVDEQAVEARMGPTLVTLLHRIRGPYNLVGHRERARNAESMRVSGVPVIRVGVEGDNRKAIAYYFDATNGMLQYVTAGSDRPSGDGTITSYQYAALPNGRVFPKLVEQARLGEHVLVGGKPLFRVEISQVEMAVD